MVMVGEQTKIQNKNNRAKTIATLAAIALLGVGGYFAGRYNVFESAYSKSMGNRAPMTETIRKSVASDTTKTGAAVVEGKSAPAESVTATVPAAPAARTTAPKAAAKKPYVKIALPAKPAKKPVAKIAIAAKPPAKTQPQSTAKTLAVEKPAPVKVAQVPKDTAAVKPNPVIFSVKVKVKEPEKEPEQKPAPSASIAAPAGSKAPGSDAIDAIRPPANNGGSNKEDGNGNWPNGRNNHGATPFTRRTK